MVPTTALLTYQGFQTGLLNEEVKESLKVV